MIKNRQTLYCVMRTLINGDSLDDVIPVGAYTNPETADEKKGAFNQAMIDRGFNEFKFEVVAVTVYDE